MKMEQMTMDNVLYGTDNSFKDKENLNDKKRMMVKSIRPQKYIEPCVGYYVRTSQGDIYQIDSIKKEVRKIYCGHENSINRYGKPYVKPVYKQVKDIWVMESNKGKLYKSAVYNENIIYQSKYILDCFVNGDIVKLKSGKECIVAGWKRGKVIEKESFANHSDGIIRMVQDCYTSILYCRDGNHVISVRNDDIRGAVCYHYDIDNLAGGDVISTIYNGICVVLTMTAQKVHIRELYGERNERFINKSQIKSILYSSAEEDEAESLI